MKVQTKSAKKPNTPKNQQTVSKGALIGIVVSISVIVIVAVVLAVYFTVGFSSESKSKFSGVYMKSADYVYDGQPKTIEVKGAPEDTTINYRYDYTNAAKDVTSSGEGNSFVESGIYKVTATLSKKGYEDRSLTATVKIVRDYTVTFRQIGYNDIVRTVKEGGTLGRSSIPTPNAKKGYTVVWEDVSLNDINKDLVVNAVEIVYTYSVEYWERSDVEWVNPNATTYTVLDIDKDLAEPTRDGCVFLGWFDSHGEKVTSLPADKAENLILKAEWLDVSSVNEDVEFTLSGSYSVSAYNFDDTFVYVEPEQPAKVEPLNGGEGIPDSDPDDVPSNVDPTETDGTQVNASDKVVTGNGEVVVGGKEVDVGGEREPQTTVVDDGAGNKVVKTLEEVDAAKYKPRKATEDFLSIPDEYKGVAVESVDDAVFKGADFTRAYIGKNVTVLGEECFRSCTYMKDVYGGENVVEIKASAFRGSGISSFEGAALEKVGDHAFAFCDALRSLTSDELTYIGDNAFENCFSLSSIIIHKNKISYIGENAFKNCNKLSIVFDGTLQEWKELVSSFGGIERIGAVKATVVTADSINEDQVVTVEIPIRKATQKTVINDEQDGKLRFSVLAVLL